MSESKRPTGPPDVERDARVQAGVGAGNGAGVGEGGGAEPTWPRVAHRLTVFNGAGGAQVYSEFAAPRGGASGSVLATSANEADAGRIGPFPPAELLTPHSLVLVRRAGQPALDVLPIDLRDPRRSSSGHDVRPADVRTWVGCKVTVAPRAGAPVTGTLVSATPRPGNVRPPYALVLRVDRADRADFVELLDYTEARVHLPPRVAADARAPRARVALERMLKRAYVRFRLARPAAALHATCTLRSGTLSWAAAYLVLLDPTLRAARVMRCEAVVANRTDYGFASGDVRLLAFAAPPAGLDEPPSFRSRYGRLEMAGAAASAPASSEDDVNSGAGDEDAAGGGARAVAEFRVRMPDATLAAHTSARATLFEARDVPLEPVFVAELDVDARPEPGAAVARPTRLTLRVTNATAREWPAGQASIHVVRAVDDVGFLTAAAFPLVPRGSVATLRAASSTLVTHESQLVVVTEHLVADEAAAAASAGVGAGPGAPPANAGVRHAAQLATLLRNRSDEPRDVVVSIRVPHASRVSAPGGDPSALRVGDTSASQGGLDLAAALATVQRATTADQKAIRWARLGDAAVITARDMPPRSAWLVRFDFVIEQIEHRRRD